MCHCQTPELQLRLNAQTFSQNLKRDRGKESTLARKNAVQINISFKCLHQEHSIKSRRDACLQNVDVYKTWTERNAPGASMISGHKDAFVSKFVPEGISVTQRTLNIGHIMLGWVLWVNHIYCQINT